MPPTRIYYILVQWIIISSVSVACYVNSCWGDFVFDDNEAVVSNRDVISNSSLATVFTNDFWGTNVFLKSSHKSYRPFTILTFRWNYWFAGELKPFHFHLANVILHPIVSVLYFVVCQRLHNERQNMKANKSDWSLCPLFASLLFAVHSVHTESVASVVGRAELMSAFCYFPAFLCYIKSTSVKSSLWSMFCVLLTIVLAGCAMLFKEQGLMVLVLCVAYDVLFKMKKSIQVILYSVFKINGVGLQLTKLLITHAKRFATRVVLISLCTAALLIARLSTGSPKFKPSDNPASHSPSWITRMLSYNYIYAMNCWLLLNPSRLCFDWSMGCIPLLDSASDCRIAAIVVFWIVFGCLLVYICVGKPGPYKRLIAMSVAMLIVPYLPATNLLIHVGFVVAERVLYLPTSGWCLLFALGLSKMIVFRKNMCMSLFVVLIVTHMAKSIQRSKQWQSEESLFLSGLTVCPHNAKVLYNIGKVKYDIGQTSIAEAAYRTALILYPEYDEALNNLGNLLKENSNLKEAEELLQRAVSVNQQFAVAWMNLGVVKAALEKRREAESCYRNALKYRRNYPDAYYNLGNLYLDFGYFDAAAAAFIEAINLQKTHVNAWNNLGLLYENQGMYDEAVQVLEEAIKQMPANPQFYSSLGVLMGRLHRFEEGKKLLSKAISIHPTSANYHANLGVIYHLMKEYEMAEQLYSHALQLDPNLLVAKDNLTKLLKSKGKKSTM